MDERVFHPPKRKGMRGHPTDLVIAWAVEKEGARRLVDMGCGNGRDAIQLIKAGLADFILGIDNAQESTTHLDTIVDAGMVPSEVAGRFCPVVADYTWLESFALGECMGDDEFDDIRSHVQAGGIDMAYSNNAIEHVDDPGNFIDVSLLIAPIATHVAPHLQHGWFQANQKEGDKHKSSWSLSEFVELAAAHGEVVDYGKLLEVPGGGQHCLSPGCEHSSMFVTVRRR